MEAIRMFIANAAHKNITVYQMDVQSAFLNGVLREEFHVSQPEGYVDQYHPNHVYKLKKTLYGLKQALRAWYDLLLKFLPSQKFSKGVVDPTLFTRKEGKDILLRTKLDKDLQGVPVDSTRYRSMVGSLMYLTCSKSDLVFVVCMCARYQERPTEKHLAAVKQHSRSKNIDVRYYFIKEHMENGVVELYFVKTEYQLANIFTKALARERFEFLPSRLRMKSMTLETLKRLAESNEE
ncbi:retrovirus-related pol polyprotein from transposon TNT 1-94 [Tanacetum coccineum]